MIQITEIKNRSICSWNSSFGIIILTLQYKYVSARRSQLISIYCIEYTPNTSRDGNKKINQIANWFCASKYNMHASYMDIDSIDFVAKYMRIDQIYESVWLTVQTVHHTKTTAYKWCWYHLRFLTRSLTSFGALFNIAFIIHNYRWIIWAYRSVAIITKWRKNVHTLKRKKEHCGIKNKSEITVLHFGWQQLWQLNTSSEEK